LDLSKREKKHVIQIEGRVSGNEGETLGGIPASLKIADIRQDMRFTVLNVHYEDDCAKFWMKCVDDEADKRRLARAIFIRFDA
jgi:hypothetical protein